MGEKDEGAALFGVVTVDDGLFVVKALVSEVVWCIRQDIAVDCYMVLGLLLADQGLGGEFAEIFQGGAIVSLPV